MDIQAKTGADAVMIGRAAQGKPWLFQQIAHFANTGELLASPTVGEIHEVVLRHLDELYRFYGEYSGCRIARKHIAWYTGGLPNSNAFRDAMYACETTKEQFEVVDKFLRQFLNNFLSVFVCTDIFDDCTDCPIFKGYLN